MNDSVMFQGLARALSPATPPMAWPVTAWKNLFFDCPIAVSTHLQQFVGRQMQEQMDLLNQLSREQNPSAFVTREAAFLQQSALAWSTELVAVGEIVQSKLLNATQPEQQDGEPPFARAA